MQPCVHCKETQTWSHAGLTLRVRSCHPSGKCHARVALASFGMWSESPLHSGLGEKVPDCLRDYSHRGNSLCTCPTLIQNLNANRTFRACWPRTVGGCDP